MAREENPQCPQATLAYRAMTEMRYIVWIKTFEPRL
jgi:hypothetical protein